MVTVAVKRSLSPRRRALVELMQHINFGRVEGLVVRGGEPVFDPPPRVIRAVKMGGDNGGRPEMRLTNFELRQEVLELFEHIERLGDGVVRCIEVKHGLPFHMEIEEAVRA
ncbi:MAG: hypothetical protein NTX87_07750 [Planctomycetota bacterium]|nr:hypothetical protein [Planctomycetota bacterium]